MSRYATRPLEVEAMQADKDMQADFRTAEGVIVVTVPKGDWLLTDEFHKQHICPDDIFQGIFVPVDDSGALFDETGSPSDPESDPETCPEEIPDEGPDGD